MSRHGSGCLVVTWCRDQGFGPRQGRSMGGAKAGCDMGLMSRLGIDVATWPVELGVAISF